MTDDMNKMLSWIRHDACHCFDYDEAGCPKECYRAQITEEYNELARKGMGFPTTFSCLRGTELCPLSSQSQHNEKENA